MSSRMRNIICIVLALALLAGNFPLAMRINDQRQANKFTRGDLEVAANPDLLLTVLLTVGRALAADYLWITANKLKEEGRFYDALQRAAWICKLQPRFSGVWVFQSWNMAYNISVTLPTPQERWVWVRNGYELLRDDGLRFNPESLPIYKQLAWTFFHKMGGLSDEFHRYYKTQMARAFQALLGENPDYEAIGKAPKNWSTLMEDPQVRDYVEKFSAAGVDIRADYFRLVADTQKIEYATVVELLTSQAHAQPRGKLDAFLKAQRLRNEWKMNPEFIAKITGDNEFGPLDFRVPEAHAVYWALKGIDAVGADTSFDAVGKALGDDNPVDATEGNKDFDLLSLRRIVYGSLQNITWSGGYHLDYNMGDPDGVLIMYPDLRFVDVQHRMYQVVAVHHGSDMARSGHINFLRRAVTELYRYQKLDDAQNYYDELRRLYPMPEHDLPLDKFAADYTLKQLRESPGEREATSMVEQFLMQSLMLYVAGDDYNALAMHRTARMVYDAYMDRVGDYATDRVRLKPFDEMERIVYEQRVKPNLSPEAIERLENRLGYSAPNTDTEQ